MKSLIMALNDDADAAWEEHKANLTAENIERTRDLLESTLDIPRDETEEFEKYVDYEGQFRTLRIVKVKDCDACCFFSTERGLHGIYHHTYREQDLNPISEPIEALWQLGKFTAYLASRDAYLHSFVERRA